MKQLSKKLPVDENSIKQLSWENYVITDLNISLVARWDPKIIKTKTEIKINIFKKLTKK